MVKEKEVDKEIPDGADELVTFSGGLYEFETSAGWVDKWPQPTKDELMSRNSFGSDKERLAKNKWLDKFIAEGGK